MAISSQIINSVKASLLSSTVKDIRIYYFAKDEIVCLSLKQNFEFVTIMKERSCPLVLFARQSRAGSTCAGSALRRVSLATKHANAQSKNFIPSDLVSDLKG